MDIHQFIMVMHNNYGLGVLMNIYKNPGILKSKCDARFGEYYLGSTTTASWVIYKMVEFGLVEERPEYRKTRLYLTPEGQEFVEDFLVLYRKWIKPDDKYKAEDLMLI